MLQLIVVFIATILLCYLVIRSIRPKGFPPGPPSVPIVGSLPWLLPSVRRIHFYMERAKVKYGSLVGVKLGWTNSILVCSGEEVIDLLKMDALQGRPKNMALGSSTANYGIILTDGPFWFTQRRFTLRHLRDFGFGKTSASKAILEEIDAFIKLSFLKSNKIQAANLFNTSAINILWNIISGKRYNHDDEQFKILLDAIHHTMRGGPFGLGIFNWLKNQIKSGFDMTLTIPCDPVFHNFIKDSIEEHKKHKAMEPRDLIDVYLQEIEKGSDPDFNELTLTSICVDLFIAGSESTGNTLSYCLLYFVLHPEEQEEVAKEVADVLAGKSPHLTDRAKLPKVEAFLSEVMRINTIAPFLPPRRAMQDVEYKGYSIPKDTFFLMSLWSVLRDEAHWGDPENFRPSRFLDERGQYVKDDWLITFGIGKRHCPGEALAKNVMFLFFVRMIQLFKFSLPVGDPIPTTLGQPGLTSAPEPFQVALSLRSNIKI